MIVYLDTSAFLKLLVTEEHSTTLRSACAAEQAVSSALLAVEAHRAGLQLGVPAESIEVHLEGVGLVSVAASTLALARSLGASTLRTLDALHLATMVELGDDVDAVVTYDRRLAHACATEGFAVATPGLPSDWWRH